MSSMFRLALVLLTLSTLLSPATVAAAPPDFDPGDPAQRLACQRAVDRIYHRHRLWPAENDRPKPRFEQAISEKVLADRARQPLLATRALEELYRDAPTAEELQRELDRIAAATRRPEMLRELFAALEDDPERIAECLVRPALVQRRLYRHFVHDARIHGEIEGQAREDIGLLDDVARDRGLAASDLDGIRGQVRLEEWRRDDPGGDYQRQLDELAALFEVEPADLPIGRLSPLIHGETRYTAVLITEHTDEVLRIAAVDWAKRPFDDWWRETRRGLTPATPRGSSAYRLPSIVEKTALETGDFRPDELRVAGTESLHEGGEELGIWAPTAAIPLRTEGEAVWTGSEMLFYPRSGNTPYAYDPALDRWWPRSSFNSPGSVSDFTAVWTGTEMIIWGGCFAQNHRCSTGAGARYNPVLDRWALTAPAPIVRTNHGAVWSGTEMLIWGGCNYDGDFCSDFSVQGARYDPVADDWALMSTTGAPTGHNFSRLVWTGDEMIVWAGTDLGGGRYDPVADAWAPVSETDAPPGQLPALVWTGTEMISWGGCTGSPQCVTNQTTGGRYDPDSDTWTPTSQVGTPSPRVWESYVWTGTEMLIWGGADESAIFGDGARYDPVTDDWTPISGVDAPIPRRNQPTVWSGTEMIVWGGIAGASRDATRSGGRYDPFTDTWQDLDREDPFSFRADHTAVWTGTEMVAWGGIGDPSGKIGTGRRYDPAIAAWSVVAAGGPPASSTHTMVWTGEAAVVWGGNASAAGAPGEGGVYDPVADAWTPTSTVGAPAGRYDHTAVWTGDRMIVWGGSVYSGDRTDTGGSYDPVTDAWQTLATTGAPEPRFRHTAVWSDRTGEMIVWGGNSATETLSSGGRYDPATDSWSPTSSTGAPSPRLGHSAVWTGHYMLIWGGYREAPLPREVADLGHRYDPWDDTWAPISTVDAPEPRFGHSTVWTGDEMVVWGGCVPDTNCIDQYRTGGHYSPETDTWKAVEPDHAPERRTSHAAVWAGELMLVWGGNARFSGLTHLGGVYIPATVPTVFTDDAETGDLRRWEAVVSP